MALFWVAAIIFSYLVIIWALLIVVGALIGFVGAIVLPIKALRGTGDNAPVIMTPESEAWLQVLPARKGFYEHLGWDRAWLNYMPFQYRQDILVTRYEFLRFQRAFTVLPRKLTEKSTEGAKFWISRTFVVLSGMLGGIAALVVMLWLGYGVWIIIAEFCGLMVRLFQWIVVRSSKFKAGREAKKNHVGFACPKCFAQAPRPAFVCPSCDTIHFDLTPGIQGVLSRTCKCGESLPLTLKKAAETLTPVCPTCQCRHVPGTGSRQTITLPVFGSTSAGKTRLLAAAMNEARKDLAQRGGSLTGLTSSARDFLTYAEHILASQQSTASTSLAEPFGQQILLKDNAEVETEIQFIDVAGEYFKDQSTTEKLAYLNDSRLLVFVLDPLALPQVQREATTSGLEIPPVATNDQLGAFESVVERIRNHSVVDLTERSLAFVVTKTDVASQLPSGAGLTGATDETIVAWLESVGQSGLLRMIESNFGQVRYFAIDSYHNDFVLGDPHNPINLLKWVLQSSESPLELEPVPEPEPESAAQSVGQSAQPAVQSAQRGDESTSGATDAN